MKALITVLAGVAMLGLPSMVNAQADVPTNMTFMLHGTGPGYTGCSVLDAASLSCSSISAVGDVGAGQGFVWLLVGGAEDYTGSGNNVRGGIGAVQFGISHDLPSTPSWSLCTGGSEIPQGNFEGTWPESDTGNAATWPSGCRDSFDNDDHIAKVGFFVVTPTDATIETRDDPRIGQALITDCGAVLGRVCPQNWGSLNINGAPGFNPCGLTCAVPIQESSWSELKSRF